MQPGHATCFAPVQHLPVPLIPIFTHYSLLIEPPPTFGGLWKGIRSVECS